MLLFTMSSMRIKVTHLGGLQAWRARWSMPDESVTVADWALVVAVCLPLIARQVIPRVVVISAYVIRAGGWRLDLHHCLHEVQRWRQEVARRQEHAGQKAHEDVKMSVPLAVGPLHGEEQVACLLDCDL